ncbi:hypothetical protein CEUSTIGMA_g4816.t1 [Chlamydomonas eustigma]|uniref:Uncharacterized protein n=1 Tax=Chlamydomonas eustigma TaxID=1157962 RepID=A0A250X3M3_9CHLO|nr:hypothetical protein CEUSTIGMA_g4816.t1 [Chlamydomonas eustigma]|eukprot:GAX77370.1 hypothetical protein CEUSTIGMA_g4816.t1 [Chlamydomonas eustigma]
MTATLLAKLSILLFFFFTLTQNSEAQNKSCGAGLKGYCNECICCCYKGAVPAYVPTGCACEAVYGPSFYVMVSVATAIFLCSVLTSMYFTPNPISARSFSPFVSSRISTSTAANTLHTVMIAKNAAEARRSANYLVHDGHL